MKYKDITIGMRVAVKADNLAPRPKHKFDGTVTKKYIAKTTHYKEKNKDTPRTPFDMIEEVRVLEDGTGIPWDCEPKRLDKIKS
jgi:hypothetical protein